MKYVTDIKKQTDNRFLNMYEYDALNKKGKTHHYFVASRSESMQQLKAVTRKNRADGVAIFALCGAKNDTVVLVRQYRCAIDDVIYELPAGLVDEGEHLHEAAIREMHEETGLVFTPLTVKPEYEKPLYTTIGLTDESCATVYGYAKGNISQAFLEDNEDITVVLADRAEAARILREENVALICAYHLMHFIHDDDPFAFLR